MKWDEWRGSLDGRPSMWIKRLLNKPWLGIDVHKMIRADDVGCFHTHPYYAVRVILYGGYVEEMENGDHHHWTPGWFGIVKPSTSHRVAHVYKDVSYSLWIRFWKCAKIELRGEGWAK